MNDCGLSEKTILKIWSVFAQYAEVEKAILYGSRAMGNYRNGSDIDLTLEGDKLTDTIRGKIDIDLDDLSLPYGIDLSVFAHLNHAKFRDHIERVGVVFYDKSTDKKKVGWKMVKLGDVSLVIAGQSPKGKNYNKSGDGVPFYQGKKDFGEKYLKAPSVWTTQITKEALADDILMSVRAPVGAINISPDKICIGRGLAAIRVDRNIIKDYLYYFLMMINEKIVGSSGAIFNSINKQQIEDILVPFVNLTYQRKVVAKLDNIFAEIETAIVATRQKRIEIAKLKAAALSACLSPNNDEWEAVKLGDVCEFQSGLWKGKKEPFINATVVRNTNFRANGYLNYDNVAILDVEEKQFKNRQLMFGDIILEKSGGGDNTPVGRVCLFERKGGNYSLSNFTACIRVKNKKRIFYRYLHYFLYSFYINGKTKSMQRYSTAIRNLQLTQYKNIVVLLPTFDHQRKIVAKLDKVFAEIETADSATQVAEQNYTALKKSILAEVFGKTSDAI